jgi:hypothetical protein
MPVLLPTAATATYNDGSVLHVMQQVLMLHMIMHIVGVLRQGQLHLTPLHAVCRLRPNLEHVCYIIGHIVHPSIHPSIHPSLGICSSLFNWLATFTITNRWIKVMQMRKRKRKQA